MPVHMKPNQRRRPGQGLLRKVGGLSLATGLAWIGYSKLFVPHNLPLPPAVTGERREINRRAGRLSYYVAGSGEPLLLIHSINAAASAYEIRPLFEHYRQSRRVYAPDLPGFGFSDRSARAYTPRLYTDAILDMLDEITSETGAGPIDALALSLSAEFLARTASENPGRFRTLALVTPSGFGKNDPRNGAAGQTRGNATIGDVLNFPLWSRPLFDLLNSKPSARYFLKKTFGSYETIDPGLAEYDYLTAHQPDAQNAPYAFLSGTLFSTDIGHIYQSLELPVWLVYGKRGQFSDFGGLQRVQGRSNWSIQALDTGALPYFEQPEAFCAAYDAFLRGTR